MKSRNMVAAFAAMLQSLGGSFASVDPKADPNPNPKKHRPSSRFKAHAHPVGMSFYYIDSHGSLRRRAPKRDKSISARQWRKQRRVARLAKGGR